jgi:hypothetical protein
MHRTKKLLAVALLLAGARAGHAAAPAGEVIRIDRPGVLDRTGATYLLTRDVTARRTAFMIKGDGITLDLGGHTVTYGTDVGVDYCHGVFLRPGGGEESFKGVPREGFGGGNSFTVTNGRIVQGKQPVAPEGAITYPNFRRLVGKSLFWRYFRRAFRRKSFADGVGLGSEAM